MLATGTVVDGRYVLEDRLGRGGMADVFRAVDSNSDQPVALKILHGESGGTRRFRSEVETLGLLDHPGIVRLLRSGVDEEGRPYLVLDLADGPSLAEQLLDGPLGAERTVDVGEQIAAGLAHAHAHGVVHRDVKPSNILLDQSGAARLADFGVARLAASTRVTAAGVVIGSAPYLAPEQVEGKGIGPAADVYALGLVLIECLTGEPCYGGSQAEAVFARLSRQPTVPATAPPWLRHVLAAMTARDPHRRPTAMYVAEAFRSHSVGPVLGATAPLLALVDATGEQDATATAASPRHLAPAGPNWTERALVLVGVLVVSFLAWRALGQPSTDGADPSVSPSSVPPPITTPTTQTPTQTTEVSVMATPGEDNGGPDNADRGHGNGNGHGKGKNNDEG